MGGGTQTNLDDRSGAVRWSFRRGSRVGHRPATAPSAGANHENEG